MNNRTNGDENRESESWLSSLARIYGPWHLGITAIQGIAWAAFVYWNESGKHAHWADTVQTVGEKTWLALPALFITSAIILGRVDIAQIPMKAETKCRKPRYRCDSLSNRRAILR